MQGGRCVCVRACPRLCRHAGPAGLCCGCAPGLAAGGSPPVLHWPCRGTWGAVRRLLHLYRSCTEPPFAQGKERGHTAVWMLFAFRSREEQGELRRGLWLSPARGWKVASGCGATTSAGITRRPAPVCIPRETRRSPRVVFGCIIKSWFSSLARLA